MLPWTGGVNTSSDPSVIPHGDLVMGEGLVFVVNDTRNMRDGINYNFDPSTANSGVTGESILALSDFWYGSTGAKTNFVMGIGSSGNLYQWNKTTGIRTTIPLSSSATAWPAGNTKYSLEVMNNMLIVAGDGNGNLTRQYAPLINSSASDLVGSPPQMSFMREWGGRLWTNDKNNRDRANYSPPGDPQTWNGTGDSGALDIGLGDGDPVGLNAYLPPFRGEFYVAKQTKIYKISGLTPETYAIQIVSDGIGCVAHNAAVSIDQDDVIFVSEKGVHSLVGTINFGDVQYKYLSKDIQKTFNTYWKRSQLDQIQTAYLAQINCVAFCVPDTFYAGTGNTSIWLYNLTQQNWFNWPNVDCQAIVSAYDSDKKRFYLGTRTGRLAKTFNGTNYDIGPSGAKSDIQMTIKTGIIFPENNPMVINGFKKFTLLWAPAGTVNVTVSFQIDNYTPQTLSYAQNNTNSVLGVSFVLGSSVLGTSVITGPQTQGVDGYGRSFQVTITQSGQQSDVNIQGFAVEFEPLGPGQETITSG